jgi:hypothetical protein
MEKLIAGILIGHLYKFGNNKQKNKVPMLGSYIHVKHVYPDNISLGTTPNIRRIYKKMLLWQVEKAKKITTWFSWHPFIKNFNVLVKFI